MPVFIENKFTYGVLVNFFLQKIMPLAYFYFGFLVEIARRGDFSVRKWFGYCKVPIVSLWLGFAGSLASLDCSIIG